MERLIVQLPDLTCASCVPQIEQILRQQKGVLWAIVNFSAGEATIYYAPIVFSATQMIKALSRSGYQVVLRDDPYRLYQIDLIMNKPLMKMQHWFRPKCCLFFTHINVQSYNRLPYIHLDH